MMVPVTGRPTNYNLSIQQLGSNGMTNRIRIICCHAFVEMPSNYLVLDQHPLHFADTMDKMSTRFGNEELPNSIRRQLQDVKQFLEESIEEYAERVQELATDGYVDASETLSR